jgi:hypothetical protein
MDGTVRVDGGSVPSSPTAGVTLMPERWEPHGNCGGTASGVGGHGRGGGGTTEPKLEKH